MFKCVCLLVLLFLNVLVEAAEYYIKCGLRDGEPLGIKTLFKTSLCCCSQHTYQTHAIYCGYCWWYPCTPCCPLLIFYYCWLSHAHHVVHSSSCCYCWLYPCTPCCPLLILLLLLTVPMYTMLSTPHLVAIVDCTHAHHVVHSSSCYYCWLYPCTPCCPLLILLLLLTVPMHTMLSTPHLLLLMTVPMHTMLSTPHLVAIVDCTHAHHVVHSSSHCYWLYKAGSARASFNDLQTLHRSP